MPRCFLTLTCTYVLSLHDTRELYTPPGSGQRTPVRKDKEGNPGLISQLHFRDLGLSRIPCIPRLSSSFSPPAWPSGPPSAQPPFLVSLLGFSLRGLILGEGRERATLLVLLLDHSSTPVETHRRRYLPPMPGARGQLGMCACLGALTEMCMGHMPWGMHRRACMGSTHPASPPECRVPTAPPPPPSTRLSPRASAAPKQPGGAGVKAMLRSGVKQCSGDSAQT